MLGNSQSDEVRTNLVLQIIIVFFKKVVREWLNGTKNDIT